ncbi:hypothetical protein CDAR_373461 [Caerostris darwini]|uniref:Uncharacterized protein n=1 Tax=Caerostris darwini TaxID=1538125 RepID=A0AAV4QKY7_9ARAC|nr:hypothetical protein CDAR_373461 [Caerostris darwini]
MGAIPRNGRSKKKKKKRKQFWNISALSCACSSSQQQLPSTHSSMSCDAGSEIGAVLPTVAAPKAGSLAHRFPSLLKVPSFLMGIDSLYSVLPHPFALIGGS